MHEPQRILFFFSLLFRIVSFYFAFAVFRSVCIHCVSFRLLCFFSHSLPFFLQNFRQCCAFVIFMIVIRQNTVLSSIQILKSFIFLNWNRRLSSIKIYQRMKLSFNSFCCRWPHCHFNKLHFAEPNMVWIFAFSAEWRRKKIVDSWNTH